MKESYKRMLIIALIISALSSITAWGFEGDINVSGNESPFGNVSDNNTDPVSDDIPFTPIIPEPEEKDEEVKEPDPVVEDVLPGTDQPAGSDPAVIYYSINPNTDSFNDFNLYVVSVDAIKIGYLDSISRNLLSVNEVIQKNAKDERSNKAELSRTRAAHEDFEKRVISLLSGIAKQLSANEAETISLDEIKVTVSMSSVQGVSEDMINEEISENNAGAETVSEDDVEVVSPNEVSSDTVSKADVDKLHEDNEKLHDDLKGIFLSNLFIALFLALLVAGQLEQIIFKRLRG